MSPPHRIVLRRDERVCPLRVGRSATDGGMPPAVRSANWPSYGPLALGRSELAREWGQAAPPYLYGAALEAPRASGFALLGASLFSNAKKVSKNACPCTGLGVPGSLRSTSLIPSSFRGPAYKGHPWPFTPLAASMPLAPLHEDSIRPSERGVLCRLVVTSSGNKESALFQQHLVGWVQPINYARWASPVLRLSTTLILQPILLSENFQTTRTQFPFRRPNVGAAQGDARHGCRARSDGTWMSLRDAPRSGAGAREVLRSKTRMLGWPSFWLLFLGHSRKSDSPSRAKPTPQPNTIKSCDHQTQRQQASQANSPLQKNLANQARRTRYAVASTRHPNQKRPSVCA